MLFAIGTRVRFLHSNDVGTITDLLDGSMVNVLLDEEDMEIPAFIDDLVRLEDEDQLKQKQKAKFVPGKKDKAIPPKRPPAEIQYTILKSLGIQLAFDPVLKSDASAEKYQMYLINDTRSAVLYTVKMSLGQRQVFEKNGKLDSVSLFHIGDMAFDQLNDGPVFEIECWQITTEGTGTKHFKKLKIKPKLFFKNVTTAPLLNKRVHLFRIFESFKSKSLHNRKEDLKTYTKKNLKPPKEQNSYGRSVSLHEIQEYAEFNTEIDLHIEKLVEDYSKMSNTEILHCQLDYFDKYISKAIRLGISKVFVIHGVGKGSLRNAISTRLIQNPNVKTFKNEYHPRYGYGATEVIF